MIGVKLKVKKIFFIFGFSLTIFLTMKYHYNSDNKIYSKNGSVAIIENHEITNQIAKKMRIFCWFIGKPSNKEHWLHLKKIWGHKCDRYVAMVSIDANITGMETHKLDYPEGRDNLWKMYIMIVKHIQKHYINDYDFFMKCDDDS
jgi:glycoprotein-N-acetylgalactosamine 3-beta-galactosyltransferase